MEHGERSHEPPHETSRNPSNGTNKSNKTAGDPPERPHTLAHDRPHLPAHDRKTPQPPMPLAALMECETTLSPLHRLALHWHFGTLMRTLHPSEWKRLQGRSLSAQDAEDLLQNAFVELYKRIVAKGFEGSPGEMLHSAVQNQLANFIRSRKRNREMAGLPSSSGERARSSAPNAERDLAAFDLAQRLLDRVTPEHQDVLRAVVLGCMSHKEAGEALGMPEGTVKTKLKAAKCELIVVAAMLLPPSQRRCVR